MTDDREAWRNRLLRRVDWRVLIANPSPGRTVCFSDGALADAVALISNVMVDRRDARVGDCDLAVASQPDRRALDRCAAALRPGGSCYLEWSTVPVGGVSRLRRRVEAAGFEDVQVYWPWPRPSHGVPQFWLPIQARGAVRFMLERRRSAESRTVRWSGVVRRLVWRLARRLGLLWPIGVVATRSGASRKAGLLTSALKAASRQSEKGRSLDLSIVLLTGGPRSVSKIVAFAVAEPDPRPLMVIKAARTPKAGDLLRREAKVLLQLERQRPEVAGIPRTFFCDQHGDVVALGQSVAEGRELSSLITRSAYADIARRATEWLGTLGGRPVPSPPAAWSGRLVEPVLREFASAFGAVVDSDALAAAERAVGSLPPLPLVCEHRDFSAWNIVATDDGQLSVLDWEGAVLDGLPGLDLLYFLTYHAFYLDNAFRSGRYRESYRQTLDARTYTGSVAAECTEIYASRVGLPSSAWAGLRVLLWMQKAKAEHRRFVEDVGGKTPTVATLQRSLFLSLWTEELKGVER